MSSQKTLEAIADFLTDQLIESNAPNLISYVFTRGDREIEVICKLVDGKSTVELCAEQQQEIEALKKQIKTLRLRSEKAIEAIEREDDDSAYDALCYLEGEADE